MTTLVTAASSLEHDTGMHPECAARLTRIRSYLSERGLDQRWPEVPARAATELEIQAVHSADYLAALADLASRGGGMVDADTVYSRGTPRAAREAAGALLVAADRLIDGLDQVAFTLVRPPGHHARPAHGMGFCIYNNVAIAARYLQSRHGIRRIAIVDFDVHHGNGTQEVFYDDPSVLYVSLHRFPFYPGTGAATETGAGDGEGTTVNVPLPAGTPRGRYLEEIQRISEDVIAPFAPEILILSAGFDAYSRDPIGGLDLEIEDYHELTRSLLSAAAPTTGGRTLSALEGGYALEALGPLVASHLEALAAE